MIFSNKNKKKNFSSELSGGRPTSKLHKEVSFGPIPFYLYLFIFPFKKYMYLAALGLNCRCRVFHLIVAVPGVSCSVASGILDP